MPKSNTQLVAKFEIAGNWFAETEVNILHTEGCHGLLSTLRPVQIPAVARTLPPTSYGLVQSLSGPPNTKTRMSIGLPCPATSKGPLMGSGLDLYSCERKKIVAAQHIARQEDVHIICVVVVDQQCCSSSVLHHEGSSCKAFTR